MKNKNENIDDKCVLICTFDKFLKKEIWKLKILIIK